MINFAPLLELLCCNRCNPDNVLEICTGRQLMHLVGDGVLLEGCGASA